MRIGLDLRMAGGGAGVSRYIEQLSLAILTHVPKHDYVLFFNQITPTLSNLYQKFGKQMIATCISHYGFEEQYKFPALIYKQKLDLMHFPHFNVPILYRKPFVVTIHDLTHTKFPGKKKSHWLYRLGYNLTLANAIKSSKRIIAISNTTKKEVMETFNTPENKIQVVYEAAQSNYRPIDKNEAISKINNNYKITNPFILYVGVWRRYKNLPVLARVFDRLVDAGYNVDLVLAGPPDPYYPEIKDQVLSIKHKDRIHMPGRVSDEVLMNLYNAAVLFVLPSKAEGFGLTPLEAAACGTPVACSDIPTLREIMGSAAEYFDPENEDNMFDVLKNTLLNPNKLEDLSNSGLRRARNFTWKQAAIETVSIYEKALS